MGVLPLLLVVVLGSCGAPTESASLAASGSEAEPTPNETAALSPSATAAATFDASGSPRSVIAGPWQKVEDEAFRSLQLNAVAWTGTRFVAGGSDTGKFLDSDDGKTWHLQDQSFPHSWVFSIAAGRNGIVAVGEIDGHPVSWFSADGLRWRMGADDESFHGPPGTTMRMSGVTETGAGWLAVGAEMEPCNYNCPQGARSVVWTSADGLAWHQVPAADALADSIMASVTRGGPGFVAVGQLGHYPTAGVVWTSTDGQSWSRIPDARIFHAPRGTDQMFGAGMHGVTTGADGTLVAVGSVGTQGDVGSALAWWSADGLSWHRADGDRFLHGQLFSVATTPTGYLATGPSGTPSCRGGIWSSSDGRAWTCVAEGEQFADFSAYDAAGSPLVELVVGFGPPFRLPGGGPGGSAWVRSLR